MKWKRNKRPQYHGNMLAECLAQPSTEMQEAYTATAFKPNAVIPKPVMKRYKAFLRDGLFG